MAVIKPGNPVATRVAGRIADIMEYSPAKSRLEYLEQFLLSDFESFEDAGDLDFNELFELVASVNIALGHLIQERQLFDWAVNELMTAGIVTESQVHGEIMKLIAHAQSDCSLAKPADAPAKTLKVVGNSAP
jgi:hypothetical protein